MAVLRTCGDIDSVTLAVVSQARESISKLEYKRVCLLLYGLIMRGKRPIDLAQETGLSPDEINRRLETGRRAARKVRTQQHDADDLNDFLAREEQIIQQAEAGIEVVGPKHPNYPYLLKIKSDANMAVGKAARVLTQNGTMSVKVDPVKVLHEALASPAPVKVLEKPERSEFDETLKLTGSTVVEAEIVGE